MSTSRNSSKSKTAAAPVSDFAAALRLAILDAIANAKKQGTRSLSLDCLFQVTRTPLVTKGAPVGANARWLYRSMFEDLCKASDIRTFIVA